jgi:hypothetical protein
LYASAKYYYGDQMQEDEMGRTCSMHGGMRNGYKILVGKPEGKKPLGRPRRRWENSTRMDLREIGWEGL